MVEPACSVLDRIRCFVGRACDHGSPLRDMSPERSANFHAERRRTWQDKRGDRLVNVRYFTSSGEKVVTVRVELITEQPCPFRRPTHRRPLWLLRHQISPFDSGRKTGRRINTLFLDSLRRSSSTCDVITQFFNADSGEGEGGISQLQERHSTTVPHSRRPMHGRHR